MCSTCNPQHGMFNQIDAEQGPTGHKQGSREDVWGLGEVGKLGMAMRQIRRCASFRIYRIHMAIPILNAQGWAGWMGLGLDF